MFEKNKKVYLSIGIIGIIVFLLSYVLSVNILRGLDDNSFAFFGDAKEASAMNGIVISEKSDIKFMLNYKNSLDKVLARDTLDKTIAVEKDKLLGLNSEEVKEIFSNFDYDLDKFTEDEVILVKNVNGFDYKEDSYFIGINDEFVSILKKGEEDNVEIVKDKIINLKDESQGYLQVKDIENKGNLLKSFYEGCKEYQFSDIQEAIDYAQALCST